MHRYYAGKTPINIFFKVMKKLHRWAYTVPSNPDHSTGAYKHMAGHTSNLGLFMDPSMTSKSSLVISFPFKSHTDYKAEEEINSCPLQLPMGANAELSSTGRFGVLKRHILDV